MRLDRATIELITAQHGVVTRAQLLAAEATKDAIAWRLGSHWRVLLPGVYQINRRAPTRAQREIAGLLAAGPGSRLAGLSAARGYGIEAADPADTVQVTVPAPRSTRQVGWLSVQRTTRPDPAAVHREPYHVSSPARAVLDAAAQTGSSELAAAIGIEAVQRRIVTQDALIEELAVRNRRGSVLARHAVHAAGTGAWSRPEAALLAGLDRSKILPPAWANPILRCAGRGLTTPDAWFDDVALAVMVHSRRYHADRLDWERTVEQDADLTEVGIVVVGVTPRRILGNLPAVIARVERTYLAVCRRPRPPVVATRRTLWAPSAGAG